MAYAEEKVETINNIPELPDISEEEKKLAQKKLDEIRARFGKKMN